MGIQGSIGLQYYFNEIAPQVKAGDLVVLLPETAQYFYIDIAGEQPLYNLISKHPASLQYLTFQQGLRAPLYLGTTIKENLQYALSLGMASYRGQPTIYEETDARGDYFGHRNRNSTFVSPKFETAEQPTFVNPEVLALLEQEKESINAKGAQLFIGFAPIAESVADTNTLRLIEQSLSENFPSHILGNSREYVLHDEKFFDTHYHLMYDERNYRTELLLKNLRDNPLAQEVLRTFGGEF